MDARNLEFKSETFDFVIDKALLDAMSCSDASKTNIAMMLGEV